MRKMKPYGIVGFDFKRFNQPDLADLEKYASRGSSFAKKKKSGEYASISSKKKKAIRRIYKKKARSKTRQFLSKF